MKENYDNLCVFNFGRHCYVVMKSNGKVMYFENVNGKYVMPITNFSLYENQGKSLTLVNQHFFMNQLVNRINIGLRKGYFSDDSDIVNYLNNLKKDSEENVQLRNLFKGSLMDEVNEENFENNKKELLKYLDKFRYDTFVNYNNVSFFNGSLEKGESVSTDVSDNVQESIDNVDVISDDGIDNVDVQNDTQVVENNEEVVSDDLNDQGSNSVVNDAQDVGLFNFDSANSNDSNEFVNSNDYFSSLGSTSSNQVVSEVDGGVNSNDYFSQVNTSNAQQNVDNSVNPALDNAIDVNNQFNPNVINNNNADFNNQVQNNLNQGNNINTEVNNGVVNNIDFSDQVNNNLNQGFTEYNNNIVNNDISSVNNIGFSNQDNNNLNNVINNHVENNSLNQETQVINSFEPTNNSIVNVNQSNNFNASLENPAFVSEASASDPLSLSNSLSNHSSNISYIDGVRDRLNTGYNSSDNLNNSQFNSEMGTESLGFSPSNVTIGDSVISDKGEMTELESISSEPLEKAQVDKADKKSHIGFIIFMILLVVALGALSFYLYKYVF